MEEISQESRNAGRGSKSAPVEASVDEIANRFYCESGIAAKHWKPLLAAFREVAVLVALSPSEDTKRLLTDAKNLLLRYAGWNKNFRPDGVELPMTRTKDVQELVARIDAAMSSPSEEKISPAAEARDSKDCGSRAETGDACDCRVVEGIHQADCPTMPAGLAFGRPRIHNLKILDEIYAVVVKHSGNHNLATRVVRSLSSDATNSERVSVSAKPKSTSSAPSVTPEEAKQDA